MKEITELDMNKYLGSIEALENPYPNDIFIEPTHEEWLEVQKLFKAAGLVQDKFFAAAMRKSWNNCLDKVKESCLVLNLDDEIDLTSLSIIIKTQTRAYEANKIQAHEDGKIEFDEVIDGFAAPVCKVEDIAPALVNAIQRAKGDKHGL